MSKFPLSTVASPELLLLCEWGAEHARSPPPAPLPAPLPSDDLYALVPHWDAAFALSLPLEQVLRLAGAASYVGCEPLLDLCLARAALDTLRPAAADPGSLVAALAAPDAVAVAGGGGANSAMNPALAARALLPSVGALQARMLRLLHGDSSSSSGRNSSAPVNAAAIHDSSPCCVGSGGGVAGSGDVDAETEAMLVVAAATGVAPPASALVASGASASAAAETGDAATHAGQRLPGWLADSV